jgi:hypothetical protein
MKVFLACVFLLIFYPSGAHDNSTIALTGNPGKNNSIPDRPETNTAGPSHKDGSGSGSAILRSTSGICGTSKTIDSNGKTFIVSHSIGQQGVTGSGRNNNYVLRQGYQQPPVSAIRIRETGKQLLLTSVYPNPFTLELNICFDELMKDPIRIAVSDVGGRIVYTQVFEALQLVIIPLEQLKKGIYTLNITSGEKHHISSVIKQ